MAKEESEGPSVMHEMSQSRGLLAEAIQCISLLVATVFGSLKQVSWRNEDRQRVGLSVEDVLVQGKDVIWSKQQIQVLERFSKEERLHLV